MIQADTRELEAKLRQTVLGIREKEVSLFTDQFAVLASSATFMSSLGFGALNMEIGFLEEEDGEYCSELVGCDGRFSRVLTPMLLFYALAAAGTAFNLLAVVLASFCMIFGPELAIRGTEESMHFAVRGMYDERRLCLKFFWAGCLFIVLSGVALGWMKFPIATALMVTIIFAILVLFCVYLVSRIAPKFAYSDTAEDASSLLRSHVEGVASTNSLRDASLRSSRVSYGAVEASSEKSGNVFFDEKLKFAVLAGGVLRLFSLDGTELSAHRASDITCTRNHFQLGKHICTGTTDRDTQAWLKAIDTARRLSNAAHTEDTHRSFQKSSFDRHSLSGGNVDNRPAAILAAVSRASSASLLSAVPTKPISHPPPSSFQ